MQSARRLRHPTAYCRPRLRELVTHCLHSAGFPANGIRMFEASPLGRAGAGVVVAGGACLCACIDASREITYIYTCNIRTGGARGTPPARRGTRVLNLLNSIATSRTRAAPATLRMCSRLGLLLLLVVATAIADDAAWAWPLVHGYATGAPPGSPTLSVLHSHGCKGDGIADCTAAILSAFGILARGGRGGTVLLPGPGDYLSGPLLLNRTTNVTLNLEQGATLRSAGFALAQRAAWPIDPAAPRLDAKGRPVLSRTGRPVFWMQYRPVLQLLDVLNVVITGGGTIDGAGDSGWWQSALRPPVMGFPSCPDPNCSTCVESCPSRPRLFLCENSSFVHLERVTFRHSPFWTTHILNSTDVLIRGLQVDNPSGLPNRSSPIPFVRQWGFGPNADGIDVMHSRRVLIEDCDIHCGDDAICLKGAFAPSTFPATSDVLARNNTIFTSCPHVVSNVNGTPGFAPQSPHRNDGCAGMKLGYGTFCGIENVVFESNYVRQAGLAIKLSSFMGEGGPLRNISFRNTRVDRTGIAINVDLATVRPNSACADPKNKCTDPAKLSSLDGLSIVNLSATQSIGCYGNTTDGAYCGGAGCMWGNPLIPLRDIRLENIAISSLHGDAVGWWCQNISDIVLAKNVSPRACTMLPPSKWHTKLAGKHYDFACSET